MSSSSSECAAAPAATATPASSPAEEEQPPAPASADDFSPVLSKSAKRRQARKIGAWRAEEALARVRTPVPPAPPSFRTPPDAAHFVVHQARGGHPSVVRQLQEMFPALEADVLSSLLQSCGGSFDSVVEMMLAADAVESREHREMQKALSASLASASSSPEIGSPQPAFGAVDHLSRLSIDLFFDVCSFLDIFELAALSAVNKELHGQSEQQHQEMEQLDFSKGRYALWSDWRILRMIARFPSVQSISLRHTTFKAFEQLHAQCFGRRIRSLSLSGCPNLEDHHLSELLGLGEHLTALDLSQTEVTDDGLEYVATARLNRDLQKIDLADCKFISSLGVLRLLERCIGLRSLDLKGTNVSRQMLGFSQQQNQLAYLNLGACRKLPAELMITSRFCLLEQLNLSNNPSLKDVTLAIPTLTNLNLSNSKHIQTLTLYTPGLKKLNMNGCLVLSKIASVTTASATFVSSLTDINTNLCRSIPSLSFHHLLQSARPTLRNLTCRGCLLLSDANLGLLLAPEDGSPLAGAQLEFLDLSGCKSASSNVVLTLQRQVAAWQVMLQERERQRRDNDAVPFSSLPRSRSSFGMRNSISQSWSSSGGLDDESADSASQSEAEREDESPQLDA